jgi:ubiquinone biosynthesis protein UbiJ
MPTYNNIDYLTMPDQVNKNKEDIEALEAQIAELIARIEALEAAA